MTTREQMDAEIARIRLTAEAGPRPRTVLAFRRREGRTIKMDTPPDAPQPGVVFLIKGGLCTQRQIKIPKLPKS